jgi:hypothetical protein
MHFIILFLLRVLIFDGSNNFFHPSLLVLSLQCYSCGFAFSNKLLTEQARQQQEEDEPEWCVNGSLAQTAPSEAIKTV